ncbi:MAG: tetratricopeptide (TPR) repeat protein [Paraglaciecola psychrophila]|jgi:tetratricopeptide (TPR) repeat protein
MLCKFQFCTFQFFKSQLFEPHFGLQLLTLLLFKSKLPKLVFLKSLLLSSPINARVLWVLLMASCAGQLSAADYVGAAQCASCHQSETEAWQGSHHDMAMRHATAEAVRGDFNNASVVLDGRSSRFFMKADQYWVNIAGPEGVFKDYQITYTFGVEPLQQYMVAFPDGRVQLIPFAWDSRVAADGGQRWFKLYPEQKQKHQEFFWTNTGQNWNYMCADCHSTNVAKNFDVDKNTYNTTFSEINVACEACHGPASVHIDWTKTADRSVIDAGFDRDLSKPVDRWVAVPGKTTHMPVPAAGAGADSQQVLVCAQCHSRHTQISADDHVASGAFGDRYSLSLINSRLYYADGQVYDEDYVYGSFLQSKMNKMGVVCSNCHEPHSAKLILPKDTVCLQCHQPKTYANTQHHHHPQDSPGAQCVNCHMPSTTYMEIDSRRDHRWHIPRPDVANSLGTPDTCLSCHQDKDSQWSEQAVKSWGNTAAASGQADKPFAPVFSAIDQGYRQAADALSHVAQNAQQAPIIRASALERMDRVINNNTVIAIARGLGHDNEHIRIGAIRGAQGIEGRQRWPLLAPLLTDKVLAVRNEAALVLMPLWRDLSADQQQQLTPALDGYLRTQDFNADRGFSHANKANVLMQQGKYGEAEAALKNSIRIDPHFANGYVNLADLYRAQSREAESIEVLKAGEIANPDNGSVPYSLGLAYIRAKNTALAIEYLHKATQVESGNAQFHYVYGLSLEASQVGAAQQAIRQAYQLGGNVQHLYALCEMQIRHRSFQAHQCLAELKTVAPPESIRALEQQLRGAR